MPNVNHYQSGDYVITGIPNHFNNKTSYWISKRGCTDAYYCFTAGSTAEVEEQLRSFDSYIQYYESRHAAATTTRKFTVETPLGTLSIWAKHEEDTPEDFPGVYVDLKGTEDDMLACVEYDSAKHILQTCVYQPGHDEPIAVVEHELLDET